MTECNFSNRFRNIFLSLYALLIAILLFLSPFSQTEANILYSQNMTIETLIVKEIYNYLQTDWGMRLPFFILSLFSLSIYMRVIEEYFKRDSIYYNLAIIIYLLIPGVTLSFILVNYATVPIFLTLLIVYANIKGNRVLLIAASVLLLFTHSAQFVVYLALALYGYKKKEWWLLLLGIGFILLASVIATYDIDGVPKGHLTQIIGIYAAIFSPILFLVVVYAIYRRAIKKSRDLLWYIVATAFVVSLLLSIRQAIKITDFAPFVVLSAPLVVAIFRDSLAIRLPEFRKFYYLICKSVLIVLLLETSIIFLHYPLYRYTQFKEILLDSSIYEIPKIVEELKSNGKVCKDEINSHDLTLYRYYGVSKCR